MPRHFPEPSTPRPDPPPLAFGSYTHTLATLARIYDISQQYQRAIGWRARVAEIEYGARTWADLHLEALGWAFLGMVGFLVVYIAWMMR